jgi:lipopolysaccharide export system protein LptC
MHTDTLRYDVASALATTQSDVRIDFGLHTLTAHGLQANLKARTIRLESKVNGRFQP